MRYVVKVEYLAGNCATVERVLPEGWEPMGGDIEDGNALRLVLARRLTEEEEQALKATEAQDAD